MTSATDYLVVIEEGPTSFGAYVPDLPGIAVAAETREECEALVREAIAFHVEGLVKAGQDVPQPHTSTIRVPYNASAA